MGGPTSVKHPYDPRRVSAPGSAPVRQAHRVVVHAAGRHVAPGLVAGGLLVAAFLSTAMVAGSTVGSPAVRDSAVESALGRSAAAAAPMQIASAGFLGESSIWMSSRDVVRSTAPARRPTVLTQAGGRVAAAAVSLPARHDPSPTPRPAATPRPIATAVPTAAHAKAVTPSPKATPKPAVTSRSVAKATPAKATPVHTTPAIVYRYRASGRATWGPFGGAVITRLPPGTQIRVCGRLGCWQGVSSGHGPSAGGGNLVDLSEEVFRRICGPLGIGVGSIVLSWR